MLPFWSTTMSRHGFEADNLQESQRNLAIAIYMGGRWSMWYFGEAAGLSGDDFIDGSRHDSLQRLMLMQCERALQQQGTSEDGRSA